MLRTCLSVRFQGLASPPEYWPSAPSRLWPAKRAALCLPDPCGLSSGSHGGKVFSGKLLKFLTQTGSQSILYDNTKLAVAGILSDGTRQRTRSFAELQSHYLFGDRFGRPGKGNDKGKVEGLVGYARRNYLVPLPEVPSFAALNAHLEQRCLARLDDRLRGHAQSIGERLERDLDALQPLPASPYDPCDRRPARVSSLSLVRYDPTTTRCRPLMVIAPCWCAAMWMRW